MKQVLYAFAVALAGVAGFLLLNLPLPWLLGPIFARLSAALLGVPMQSIKPLNEGMGTVLGVAVGATLPPPVLATFPAMWPTLMLVPVMVIAIGVLGIPYLRRVWGYDAVTAYYSANVTAAVTIAGLLHFRPPRKRSGRRRSSSG